MRGYRANDTTGKPAGTVSKINKVNGVDTTPILGDIKPSDVIGRKFGCCLLLAVAPDPTGRT